MKRPAEVTVSREKGEALLARLEANTLTAEDRRVLGKVLTLYPAIPGCVERPVQ